MNGLQKDSILNFCLLETQMSRVADVDAEPIQVPAIPPKSKDPEAHEAALEAA